jgi:hypothetical protein
MIDKSKGLAMVKAVMYGENPKKPAVLERWMTVPATPKQQSILSRVEKRFAGQSNPSDEEIVQAIKAYAKV